MLIALGWPAVALLLPLLMLRGSRPAGCWSGGLWLAAYAVAFSFAYRELDAGLGALLLFAAVQVTMIGWGIARGERPSTSQ